jgi:hypothetical protein
MNKYLKMNYQILQQIWVILCLCTIKAIDILNKYMDLYLMTKSECPVDEKCQMLLEFLPNVRSEFAKHFLIQKSVFTKNLAKSLVLR